MGCIGGEWAKSTLFYFNVNILVVIIIGINHLCSKISPVRTRSILCWMGRRCL